MKLTTALIGGAAAFTAGWPLAGYPATLAAIARLRPRPVRRGAQTSSGALSIAVVVPTYNESANITARLQNLAACEYPRDRYEIIVVDAASPDGTADAVDAFAARRSDIGIRLIREPGRSGKASATNTALRNTSCDLILVTDAPTRFHPDAVRLIAENFTDPRVGAATGVFEVFDPQNGLQREEGLFWRIRNTLRTLESDVDSTPFLSGEFCCFRRRLIDRVDANTIADDMNIALQTRRGGYRTIVDQRVLFSEPRSPELDELLVRKTSRAAGGVQELLRHRDMMFDRRLGMFGMLIMPSDLLYYVPLRLPALAIVTALTRKLWLRPRMLVPAALVLAAPPLRRRVKDLAYVALFNEWLFARAWHTVLTGKTEVLWVQERRRVVPGASWESDGGAAGRDLAS